VRSEQHHFQQFIVGQRTGAAGEQALTQPLAVAVVVRLLGRLAGFDAPAEPPCLSKDLGSHLAIKEQIENTSQVASQAGTGKREAPHVIVRDAALRDVASLSVGRAWQLDGSIYAVA
jgi:hypothetical protein